MEDANDSNSGQDGLQGLLEARPAVRQPAPVAVAGLGGSAGSVEALLEFFSHVGAGAGLAYVVVIHLSPHQESALPDLIQQRTNLPVSQVTGTTRIEPDHVYVIPPGKALRATPETLEIAELGQHSRNVAVDIFFRTLANSHGARAAAVVLSGSDGDGAVGLRHVKERGGLTIVQEPEQAMYPGMPNSALATGMVDWVLPVREMPARIASYFQIEHALKLPPEDGPPPGAYMVNRDTVDEASLRDVLALLRTRTGRNFGDYKRATILRRIGRRMQVNGVDNLAAYLHCLRTRPGEASALLQDLLITVTNFFRDPECFQALREVIPSLFAGKGAEDTVRVWVAACATGEEAYSIAMLLAEHARTLDPAPTVQVFATDLDEEAIRTAREALYPAAIEADVDEDRLKRFFVKEHEGYRVRRELREMVLFAVHDVLKDSPFSRLDLVSCRNLLIYLNRDAQSRVLDTFHFALLPRGHLFLGSSEAVDDASPLFSVVDKKHRIYAQRSGPRIGLPVSSGPSSLALAMDTSPTAREAPVISARAMDAMQPQRPRTERQTSWGELHLRLLELLAPPSILVDAEYDILHLSPSAGRFLQYGGGEPSRNLLRVIHEGLRIELRASLYQAAQSRATIDAPPVAITIAGQPLDVTMRVVCAGEVGADIFLVLLDGRAPGDAGAIAAPGASEAPRSQPDPVAHHLERELERLKSHLRDTVEQYEASTEELKASNEELQAMNEELRSATEELETSREELQSINEELTTVNQELKCKVDELGHANSDMQNLIDATAIATVFLDRDLRITRYTPSAVSLFNFIPSDVGRPLSDLTSQLAYPELGSDARRVLEKLVPVEREVGQSDNSWYLARLLPYRTIEDRIAGVVLSFIDITERKRGEEMQLWLSAVVKATPDAIISFSLDGHILSWNSSAERTFGYTAKEAIGQPLRLLAGTEVNDQAQVLSEIAQGRAIEHHVAVRRRKDGRDIHVSLAAAPILDSTGRVIAGTAVVRDITELRAVESEIEVLRRQVALAQAAQAQP